MKYLSIFLLFSISSYVTDLYNWVSYENKSLYNKTSKSGVVYERDGVKIYKNSIISIITW